MTTFLLTPEMARHALSLFEEPPLDDTTALERYATVTWCQLTEPGDSVAHRLIAVRGSAAALRAIIHGAPLPELTERERTDALKRWLPRLDPRPVADALRIAGARGISLVTPGDASWPSQLDDLDAHAPLCLWVRGDATALASLRPSVALVGARAASSYGDHVARELAADLAGSGIPIVSGGAYGIDGAAHRAALAVGGLTVALLAGGAERAYPAGHTGLIDDIAAAGVVASEVPCGSAPTKWRFLQRNRLIAAISDATVVVEAGWRSGSLNTAGHAAALSRELGAVPGPVTSATSAGTHRLLREYGAHCITGAEDVREMLGFIAETAVPHDGRRPTDDATRVRDALSSRTWRAAADVARRAGIALERAEALLGLLQLEGAASRSADGWRSAARTQ
ncbi:DNA-processing protein DprA [Microbacterium sp. HD4P20]|uniref:DNA-processing protein DprA n=1 Tax=Microbacterium sp. HD4P20 TaxID=2864874 RepID=UPI001C63E775|nr:DNA-processing protein DprA [Microbacterium sp. HD4P20]MCP2636695.1 DNA-processing protein DprA [Microbacterium sp. HD4P20]